MNNPAPRLEGSCLFKPERAYIVICLLAPRKEIQDDLGFWLPHHRFKIPGSRFQILRHKRKRLFSGTWPDSGSRTPDHKAKLSRPGFRFSQAKIFQNFGVTTLSKVACAGENLTREKIGLPWLFYQKPITRNDNFHAFVSQCFHGPVYF